MLSSRLLRPTGRQFLSTKPPIAILLSQLRLHPKPRTFHATTRRSDAVLDTLLVLPHELMNIAHSQLPWYAAIPTAAFLLRAFLVTTVGSRTRAITARYAGIRPLAQAIALQTTRQMYLENRFGSPKQAQQTIKAAVKRKTLELEQRWECRLGLHLGWTVLQLPIFITMAETMRQMCNTQDGLLAMTLRGMGLKDAPESIHDVPLGPPNPWFEPSLANEGALWFSDLLVPDPTGVLPFVVSGLMFANVYFTKNTGSAGAQTSTFSKNLRRVLLVVSLSIGPICQHLPAALMLYWAGSTSSVMLWNMWLDWRYPVPVNFGACKRPLQMATQPKLRPKVSSP